MNVKKYLCLFAAAALLLPPASRAGDGWDVDVDLRKRSAGGAAVRSLLVPGWGQTYNRQWPKGGTLFLVAVGGAAGALLLDDRARTAYKDYQAKGVPEDASYDRYRRERSISVMCGGVSAFFWVFAVVDAYIEGRRLEILFNDEARAPAFQVALSPGGASAVWRFGGEHEED